VDQGAAEVFFARRLLSSAVAEELSFGRRVEFGIAFNLKGPVAVDILPL
jgi:cold shock CspA family protein